MPEENTVKRARKVKREGKAASSQAGEFVREEIHHVRRGKHGARSAKQAVAIGLSKARRAGVKLPPPEKGEAPEKTRESAKRALKRAGKKASPTRSRARRKALKREPRKAASKAALSREARSAAAKRTRAERSASAKKAAKTRKK